MQDIAIILQDNCFQLALQNGDLKGDAGLETSVIISLFTNKRVPEGEIPAGLLTQEGWWGDLFGEIETDQIGSKLWTLARSKITPTVLPQFETEAKNSLQWMLEDGVAQAVDAVASFDENNRLVLEITISKPNGEQLRFGFLWDGQELVRT